VNRATAAGAPAAIEGLRYCTTADGVRLAMRSVGKGPLVIKAAN